MASAITLAIILTARLILLDRTTPTDSIATLVKAASVLPERPTEVRLDGFVCRPVAARRARDVDPRFLHLATVAHEIMATTQDDWNDAGRQHAAGVAALIAGRTHQAVEHLERAAALAPTAPECWSDLSAARYEWARASDDRQGLVDALVAVDRALRERPGHLSALYNRALVIDALDLPDQALSAYNSYRATDSNSAWAAEASVRAARLRVVKRSEIWKSVVPRLRQAVASGDRAAVSAMVKEFPQEARTWGEAVFLYEWAAADGSPSDMGLSIARSLGEALKKMQGESLLADSVTAIDMASPAKRAALREGHRAYLTAGKLYAARHVADAMPLFERAMARFREGGSPISAVCDYYLGNCLYDLSRNAEALLRIDEGLARVPERYVALRALLLWERGTILSRGGRIHEALAAQTASLLLFERLGENNNLIFMSNSAAASLSLLGHNREAWRLRVDMFRRIALSGNVEYEQIALDTAARTEALLRHWDRTYSLLTLAVDPTLRVNPRVVSTSLLWRALAGQRAGIVNLQPGVEEARRVAASIPESQLRRSAEGEALLIEGVLARPIDARKAITLLSRFLVDAAERHDDLFVAEALLERARAQRALGDDTSAVNDLSETLRWLSTRTTVRHDDYRDAFFSTADATRRELVDLLERRGEVKKAYEASAIKPTGRSPDRLVEKASPGTLVVQYLLLPDRLVMFVVDASGMRVIRSPVNGRDVQRTAEELTTAVTTHRDDLAEAAAHKIARWLIDPIDDLLSRSRTLVVVPDRGVAGVPFAALRRRDGTRIIEHAAILLAPDVEKRSAHPHSAAEIVLSVGNPRFDQAVFPFAINLPAARIEAQVVAARWKAAPLTGSEATVDAVVEHLRDATIANLATHAFIAPDDPARSFLLFAPSATNAGALYLPDIERLSLSNLRVVVLAGCRTAASVSDVGEESSLARAFIRAGAANVIGSLWDVDDDIGLRFSVEFHREMRSGITPAAALRNVQLSMLHSSDPTLRRIRSWGGFCVYATNF